MKNSQRTLAAFLVCLMVMGGAAYATPDTADVVESFSKTALSGQELRFDASDFLDRVNTQATLDGIVIASLPAPEIGVLCFGEHPLIPGETVMTDGLSGLVFVPSSGTHGTTAFQFLPVFEGVVSETPVVVGINLTHTPNRVPIAENLNLVTYQDIPISSPFAGSDPDREPLTYRVTQKPGRGELTLSPDGNFTYTPFEKKTGVDQFSYTAVDPAGNVSDEAVVKIDIQKKRTDVLYSDMTGHPAHYAALKLAENDVFVGERLGSEYCFEPTRYVTRGEFLAMVVAATGLSEELTPVLRTGFSDDALTPTWVKPYASLALKTGIVLGVVDPLGRRELRSESIITRSEAATMLNRALKLTDAGVTMEFADQDQIPSWAAQSAVNVDVVGVMSAFDDGTMRPTLAMTRADAALSLAQAIAFQEANAPKTGLLDWLFG